MKRGRKRDAGGKRLGRTREEIEADKEEALIWRTAYWNGKLAEWEAAVRDWKAPKKVERVEDA